MTVSGCIRRVSFCGAGVLAALFCLFLFIYMPFIYVPVTMYAEAECLRNGYPRASVTVGLERYCTKLDGVVSVKVVKP
jgi:uncharacterized membrane protein YjfL (UPF0719 family)